MRTLFGLTFAELQDLVPVPLVLGEPAPVEGLAGGAKPSVDARWRGAGVRCRLRVALACEGEASVRAG